MYVEGKKAFSQSEILAIIALLQVLNLWFLYKGCIFEEFKNVKLAEFIGRAYEGHMENLKH